MPRENKKRGRRGDRKRKHDDEQDEQDEGVSDKRHKVSNDEDVEFILDDKPSDIQSTYQDPFSAPPMEPVFYGNLDEDEQEVFKRAHALLNQPIGSASGAFPDEEAKTLFLENLIWKEADGKELKLACSQSCSRFLEDVMQIASAEQLKRLFLKFSGNFLHLVQHRFASHCCQTLFLVSARFLGSDPIKGVVDEEDVSSTSFENLFVRVVEELNPNLGFLMTDVFGSHVLRTLLIVLSGRPLSQASSLGKKVDKQSTSEHTSEDDSARQVPQAFAEALQSATSHMTSNLDTTTLHVLATHPVGNPILQLLIDLELSLGGRRATKSQDSLYSRLLPDEVSREDSQSIGFVNHLLYDPVGSRLLEVIFQKLPDKTFKHLYSATIEPRLKSILRNDSANFVLQKCIERMREKELQSILEEIPQHTDLLIERNRSSILKTLVERCKEKDVKVDPLIPTLHQCIKVLPQLILPDQSTLQDHPPVKDNKSSRSHWTAFFISLLSHPSHLIESQLATSILNLSDSTFLLLCRSTTASRLIQSLLTTCSDPSRKPLVHRLLPLVQSLAPDVAGSHVIEALLPATQNLRFLRIKIGGILQAEQRIIEETQPGRIVCMKWNIRAMRDEKGIWAKRFESVEEREGKNRGQSGKSAIEMARKRFTEEKGKRGLQGARGGRGRGVGGIKRGGMSTEGRRVEVSG